jgi:hypothetical protein
MDITVLHVAVMILLLMFKMEFTISSATVVELFIKITYYD